MTKFTIPDGFTTAADMRVHIGAKQPMWAAIGLMILARLEAIHEGMHVLVLASDGVTVDRAQVEQEAFDAAVESLEHNPSIGATTEFIGAQLDKLDKIEAFLREARAMLNVGKFTPEQLEALMRRMLDVR